MRVREALAIYDVVKHGSCPNLSIGGYPALVMQGIIPDSRETKDLDLCNFSSKSFLDYGLEHVFRNSLSPDHVLLKKLKIKTSLPIICVERQDRVISGSRGVKKGNEHVVEQSLNFAKMGINSAYSLTLSIYNPVASSPSKEDISAKYGAYYRDPFEPGVTNRIWQYDLTGRDPFAQHKVLTYADFPESKRIVNSASIAIYNTIDGDYQTLNKISKELLEEIIFIQALSISERSHLITREISLEMTNKHVTAKIKAIDDEALREIATFAMDREFSKLHDVSEIIKENDGLSIDIFELDWAKRDKFSVMVHGRRYVHYYLILKAKHEYCLNPLTDQVSFNKHITDLKNSYKVRPIDGINSPKDINNLISIREGNVGK